MFCLEQLGWNSFFDCHFDGEARKEFVATRVAEESRGKYRVYAESGVWLAELSGRLRYEARKREDLPAVGDWVLVRRCVGEERATIYRILPRRSRFSRKTAGGRTEEQIVATNVDTVFLVSSLNREFNLRRIERYLTLVWDSGARAVVVLNKSDLCDSVAPYVAEAESIAMGVPVHVASALTGVGMDALSVYLGAGQTVALLGSSGVGKSTLINRLRGDDALRTQPVRDSDDRGRHATTSRQLIPLAGGGLLIDTPGMRELQLWDCADGLEHAFADIEALALQCHFTDCRHESEPRCAVRESIHAGSLDPARVESYRKLGHELAFLERKKNVAARLTEKSRVKRLHRTQRKMYRDCIRNDRW